MKFIKFKNYILTLTVICLLNTESIGEKYEETSTVQALIRQFKEKYNLSEEQEKEELVHVVKGAYDLTEEQMMQLTQEDVLLQAAITDAFQEEQLKVGVPGQIKVPSLYLIEKDGKSAYILGTVHILPVEEFSSDVHAIIASCRFLVSEAKDDSTDVNPFSSRANMKAFGGLRDKKKDTWWEDISSLSRDYVEHWLTPLFETEDKLEVSELKQSFIEDLVTKSSLVLHAEDLCMDDQLIDMFEHKKVFSLESYKEQSKITNEQEVTLSPQEIEEFDELIQNIAFADSLGILGFEIPFLIKAVNMYRQGISDYDEIDPAVDARNELWMPRIKHYFKELEEPGLFAFGEGHLDGSKGILNLLVENGFFIKKFDPSFSTFLPLDTSFAWEIANPKVD